MAIVNKPFFCGICGIGCEAATLYKFKWILPREKNHFYGMLLQDPQFNPSTTRDHFITEWSSIQTVAILICAFSFKAFIGTLTEATKIYQELFSFFSIMVVLFTLLSTLFSMQLTVDINRVPLEKVRNFLSLYAFFIQLPRTFIRIGALFFFILIFITYIALLPWYYLIVSNSLVVVFFIALTLSIAHIERDTNKISSKFDDE